MKSLSNIKRILIGVAIVFFCILGNNEVYAVENHIESGIYEVENYVYHESEIGMAMSRSYLLPTMTVEVRNDSICYTIGFSGSQYMDNYRMNVNGEEASVETIEDNETEGIIKLKLEVDKVDADMEAIIYVEPMERDVKFKVIPKMETLNLVESIEENAIDNAVTSASMENVNNYDINSEEIQDNKFIMIAVLIGGIALATIFIIVIKKKRKRFLI